MYRPSWLNLTSEIDEMISEKNDRVVGSSSSSKPMIPMRLARYDGKHEDKLAFCVSITQGGVTHVSKLDVAF